MIRHPDRLVAIKWREILWTFEADGVGGNGFAVSLRYPVARVLVLEDNALVRQLLCAKLRAADLDVVEGQSGREVWDNSTLDGVDIVVTDIVMPDRDGLEVLKYLKQTAPELPVIAVSAQGGSGDGDYLKLAKLFGAAAVFEKPVDDKQVISKIHELVTKD